MFKRRIRLPTTLFEFDILVARVVKTYKLTDANHAAAVISATIRHIPPYPSIEYPNVAYTTLDYLGQSVLKNIANYVANHKSQTMKHESEVAQLASILIDDPNNQQARDELQKAADHGSKPAIDALAKLTEKVEDTATAN